MSRGLGLIITSSFICISLLPRLWADRTEHYSAMTVVVCEETGLNVSTLQISEDKAMQVFHKAGIDVTWLAACDRMPTLASYFVVVIVPRSLQGWASPTAMGFAPIRVGPRRRAYIFLDRVKLFVKLSSPQDRRPSTVGTALGYTMAHELGHLLIPGDAHSDNGVMSPKWSDSEWQNALKGTLVFLPWQAKTMQKTLAQLASPGV